MPWPSVGENPNSNRKKVTRTLPEPQGAHGLPGILEAIVRTKRDEVSRLRERAREVERRAEGAPSPRDFHAALAGSSAVSLIAECKRRSPGAGDIRPDLDPEALGRGYEAAGASALSVLTDASYFGGGLDDLERARAATSLPVLRKDFTLDPLQIVEARGAGADAVLLIVRILDEASLRQLMREAEAAGLSALVETHDEAELRRALDAGADIVGVNNRDLASFTTDLDTTLRLLEEIPDDAVVVSESGIRGREDVGRLGAAGVDAVLVGETLLRSPDPAAAARKLSGIPRTARGHA
jgi:indole-3-glycerol phosphate synthase